VRYAALILWVAACGKSAPPPRPRDAAVPDAKPAPRELTMRHGECVEIARAPIAPPTTVAIAVDHGGGTVITGPEDTGAAGLLCAVVAFHVTDFDQRAPSIFGPDLAPFYDLQQRFPVEPADEVFATFYLRDAMYGHQLTSLVERITPLPGNRKAAACVQAGKTTPPDVAALRPAANDALQAFLDTGHPPAPAADPVAPPLASLRALCGFTAP